jgi:hypothetical protein
MSDDNFQGLALGQRICNGIWGRVEEFTKVK